MTSQITIKTLQNFTYAQLKDYQILIEDPSSHHAIQFFSAIKFIKYIDFNKINKIADIGSGPGHQAYIFSLMGLDVTCIDFVKPIYSSLKWEKPTELDNNQKFDAIWSHHCLEHIQNPIKQLCNWNALLKEGGYLFLTVPEFSCTISSGHINLYSLPLLMYHLAIAGFDCSKACFCKEDSHLRAVVNKSKLYNPSEEIQTSLNILAQYKLFPPSVIQSIDKNGRFSINEMVLRWFDGVKKPARDGIKAYNFVLDSLWH